MLSADRLELDRLRRSVLRKLNHAQRNVELLYPGLGGSNGTSRFDENSAAERARSSI